MNPLRPPSSVLLAALLILATGCQGPPTPSGAGQPVNADATRSPQDAKVSSDPGHDETDSLSDGGRTPRTCLVAEPSTVFFGGSLVGQIKSQVVALSSCQDTSLAIDEVAFSADSAPQFSIKTEPALPTRNARDHVFEITVQYLPTKEAEFNEEGQPTLDTATLLILGHNETLSVPLSGLGILHDTPTAKAQILEGPAVSVGTPLHLVGDLSRAPSGSIAAWQWDVQQPTDSEEAFQPESHVPNPIFTPKVPGLYTFSLIVWDELGSQSPVPWTQTVVVSAP